MPWCQGAQNIGLSNHKLKSAISDRMITMHPAQTDRQRDRRTSIINQNALKRGICRAPL